jgi:ABC transport system ATP-binding/permease protein
MAFARLQLYDNDIVKDAFLITPHTRLTIGRKHTNTLVLRTPKVLPFHAAIYWLDDRVVLQKCHPAAEIWVNQQQISSDTPQRLTDGDEICIGPFKLVFEGLSSRDLPHANAAFVPSERSQGNDRPLQVLASTTRIEPISLRNRTRLSFGRDPNNDVVIDHPVISLFHATLEWQTGTWSIKDLESSHGTYINERAMQQGILQPGDILHIGPYEFQLTSNETLIQRFEVGKLRLDACNLVYKVGNLKLLHNISLSVLPEEFVTIVGVSGAGKSTLLNALSGFRPATRGSVFVNGHNLYQNYDAYRTNLGYVPQDDIIHLDLTVQQALDFAARLRLPPDISAPERRRQVQQVLEDLELLEQSKTLVKNLSGGQRKRVSIGVELLTKPSLFFLDEATSGLDPGTELQMMRLLRRMATQGRTVILVTHTTKNLSLSDLVVFLAKGGRVAFFGPPQDALTYFEVQEFDEIYIKVEEERSPEEWALQYQESPYYQQYVVDRQASLNGALTDSNNENQSTMETPNQSSKPSFWRQLRLLSQRNLTILIQDRTSFLFLLAVAPILGLLDFVMWRRNMFDTTDGDPGQCFTLMFISVLISVIVGSLSTMREVVKEAEIYRRERMIGLQIIPYILSKVWFSAVLATYQAAIFLVTKELNVNIPGDWHTGLAMYFTLFLSTLGGMIMGLLVSALASSQNVAPLLTILFLVPQITFAGSFIPLHTLGTVGQAISASTITRWSFESMVTLSGVGRDIAQDPCWQQPQSVRDKWKDTDKAQCKCMGPQLFDGCSFPGLRQDFNPAVNQPEPIRPKNLGDPPTTPENLLGPDGQQFADDIKAYSEKTKTYRKDIDQWQDRFSQWKEKRGRAIASGEALLDRFNRNQGNSFAVDVLGHWLKLGALILVTLGLLVGVQKRKDWI